jgi:hypothetical protein
MRVPKSGPERPVGSRGSFKKTASLPVLGLLLIFLIHYFGASASASAAIGAHGDETVVPGVSPSARLKAVQAYAEAFEVSEGAADRALEVQEAGAGLSDQLASTEANRFAGIWFDNRTGKFVVPMLSSASKASVQAVIAAGDLKASEVEFATATFSWEELEDGQRELDKTLQPMIASNLVQTSLNPKTNAIVVSLAKGATKANVAAVNSQMTEISASSELKRVDIPEFEASPAACNTEKRVCDKPLRGGVYIEGGAVACSSAFKATGNTTGSRYVLTAGHCAAAAAGWNSRDAANVTHYIGQAEGRMFPGAGDWTKIKVDGSYWDEGSSWPSIVANWSGNESTSITSESSSYVGEAVCHSGWRTGTSCGVVRAIEVTVHYPQGAVIGMTEVAGPSLCAYLGDSGGPVWTDNTAVGLFSGILTDGEACGGRVGFYAEVTRADAAMGVTIASGLAGGEYYAAFQSSNKTLWEKPQASQYGANLEDRMAANSSPSSAAYPGGGFVTAFQDWQHSLWLYSTTSHSAGNSALGMEPGTSPSVAVSPGGSYIAAFHAYGVGELWFYNSLTGSGYATHSGMAAGSSPSAAWVPGSGYVIAFENQQGELMMYNVASEKWVKPGLGMQMGTSPSIAAAPQGGYAVAFQDWQHHLWTYSSLTQGAGNTALGMEAGTSPSIAFGVDGNYLAAFHANTGELWYYQSQSSGGVSTKSGMQAGTNPSTVVLPRQGFLLGFQSPQSAFWLYSVGSKSWVNTTLGMAPGSSPSLAEH